MLSLKCFCMAVYPTVYSSSSIISSLNYPVSTSTKVAYAWILPKFYNDRMDSSAWDAYKSGLESERRTNQIDISAMFNLDDIEEPEGANLDARIDDAVWNVDPEK